MAKGKAYEDERATAPDEGGNGESGDPEFKVEDRRHWQRPEESEEAAAGDAEPARPSIIDEYRRRAEQAEAKLLEYIEAFKRHKAEQEQFRVRLSGDVDRRVSLQFGELIGELLEVLDHLDLGLAHAQGTAEADPLAQGVEMARDHFLATLARHGVQRISPEGTAFDPNEAEALRVDRVDSADANDVVTETLKPGYRLDKRVIRAAKVAVGRYRGESSDT